ncbi:hypothetical protein [Lacinutrix sp. Hel_I_90]|uniref:hypothetical protein n=1 Tax=Lacinutrix sp. Hel_I_90 TaxID=1249999 RepID=UPI0005C80819|nr:hypothetical protein [Lacinutrix sp. Hel_I_90]
MKNEKVLRIITIIALVFSLFQAIRWIVSYFQIKFNLNNPLIPSTLVDYVRFPIYLLFPIFFGIAKVCYGFIIKKEYKPKIVLPIFGILVLYFFFGADVYQCIQTFNPYNS